MAKEKRDNQWQYLYDSDRVNGGTPQCSGIYLFIEADWITKRRTVVYVGKSQDLSVRLKPWHKIEHRWHDDNRRKFSSLFCYILLTDEFHEKEVQYIHRFRPRYNICHNRNYKRKVEIHY